MADQTHRQTWMATLAKASPTTLAQLIESLIEVSGALPVYEFLRPPEIGLTMVRGRAGGTGDLFNLGEMPLTRCVVQLSSPSPTGAAATATPIAGFGYVAGRSQKHAELAAVCDALMQHPDWAEKVQTSVIEPLATIAQAQQDRQHRQVEATRVNFLTMQRGE